MRVWQGDLAAIAESGSRDAGGGMEGCGAALVGDLELAVLLIILFSGVQCYQILEWKGLFEG